MKRMWISACLAVIAMAIPVAAQQQAQPSLADAARAARADKATEPKPKLVFDNDSLPRSGDLSVVGTPTAAPKQESPKDAKAKADKGAADKDAADALAKQIADKQKEIADLTREIDVMQREHKLKLQNAYVDVGPKLQKKWGEDEKKYTDDLADRNKKLADAQTELVKLQAQQKSLASAQ